MKTLNISRILVPTDFSDTGLLAVEHAAHMAKLFNAELYLLHMIEMLDMVPIAYETVVTVRDFDKIEQVVTEKLQQLAQRTAEQYGIKVEPVINSGRITSGIAETAGNINADIIIMGTHGAKGFQEYFIGSNAHKTVNLSPCPVITIQANTKKPGFTNMVMPIDDTIHSRQKVNHVIALATKYNARIHILGLLNPDEETDEKKFNIKLDAVEKAVKHAGLDHVRVLVKGRNIAVEAMSYSESVDANLIVIMTDHESNLTGRFIGALAKQIVNHSLISVMSIKPVEGKFESIGSASPF